MDDPESARLRIGELSRRVGVSPELLRAWETRYRLVCPERTAGGLRLYSADDERRVRLMREHIRAGIAAAEAARLAKLGDHPGAGRSPSLAEIELALERSLRALDEPAAQAALDRLFGEVALPTALSAVLLPFLHRLGQGWARSQITVAEEHFASNVIGGRLRTLARGWGDGVGPRAFLACPPGEQHELGLLCFGLGLRQRGWRITYFGAQTPPQDLAAALGEHPPAVVVLSAIANQRFLEAEEAIIALARRVRVAIGGAGATDALARRLSSEWLGDDLMVAAAALAP